MSLLGAFLPGSAAGHDVAYARLRLLDLVYEHPQVRATAANEYTDIARWLPESHLLITYVAGPYPTDEQHEAIRQWLAEGGRWFALHGTSGGKAVRVGETPRTRKMVKMSHYTTLGGFFLNHLPVSVLQRFRGAWETAPFTRLPRNGIAWGLGGER